MVTKDWIKTATVDWKYLRGRHIVRAPIENLRVLLRHEDKMDASTSVRFIRWSRGERRDIRFEADTIIAGEMDPHKRVEDCHRLDFSDLEREAAEADEPRVAAEVYLGMTESLGMHYEIIDDSRGNIGSLFEKCMEELGACILAMDLWGTEKWEYIQHLAIWSLRVFPDFMEYYHNVLVQLCGDRWELAMWKGSLKDEMHRIEIGMFGDGLAIRESCFNKAYSLVSERMKRISE